MQILSTPKEIENRNVRSFLEMYNLESGERTLLKEFDYLIEAPNWTPDGNFLIYNSRGKIFSYQIQTGKSEEIYSGICTHCNNDHVLSADGESIAVSHHTKEDGESRIYIFPLRGGDPVLITPIAPSYLHGWSPDKKTIAYCAERNGQYDIYTIPAIGGIETKLTNEPGLDDGPEYSPDGKYIWFNSVRSGLMQIWRMNADGSKQTRITFDEMNNWFPHLSPNGRQVVFISYYKEDVAPGDHPANKNVEIRLMNSDGSDCKTLIKLFGGQGSLNVNSWSPDNKKIAFVSYQLK
jgi:Tol biopolymer transport system component